MSALSGPGDDRRIRVVVAVSDASVRRSLADDLEDAGFVVCAVEARAPGAIEAASFHEPDIVVLGADLAGSAVIATARLAEGAPRTKVMVVAEAPDEDDCLTYLMVGASGYIGIQTDAASLAPAIRGVAAGQAIVPPAAQRRLLEVLRAQLG